MLVIVSRHLKRISRTQIGSEEALAAKRRLLPEDHLDIGRGHG
jgi:hypothetical protein